jgi:hypothetical protein
MEAGERKYFLGCEISCHLQEHCSWREKGRELSGYLFQGHQLEHTELDWELKPILFPMASQIFRF